MAVDQNWQWVHNYLGTLDLQQVAWNIATFGGRMRMAGRRGSNVAVSYRDGTLWTPKDYNENEIDLAMWVLGCNTDGTIPDDPPDVFWDNLQTLRRMFTTDLVQGNLLKMHPVLNESVVAQAEIRDVIDFVSQAGATRAAFIVRMVLPEIWFRPVVFYGDPAVVERSDTEEWTVTVDSDVFIKDPIIVLEETSGAASNVRIYNDSLGPTHWVIYQGTVGAGETVTIDVKNWKATLTPGDLKVTGAMDWSGQPQMMWLKPGENDLRLESASPVGVQVMAKGAYW